MARSKLQLSPDIAARLRARDSSAFDELLRSAGPPIIAFLTSYVHSQDVAEDLFQNILLRIWQLGETLTPEGAFEPYLFGMARNEALAALRKDRIREHYVQRYTDAVHADHASGALDDASSIWEDRLERVRRALSALTEHQRTAFELRYGQEMKIAEIAQVLGISEKGVERLMTRIKKLLTEQVLDPRD